MEKDSEKFQHKTHNMYEGSFWSDGKVLKLDHSGSCATL